MRSCRGQASLEYLALVGLIAVVLGALAPPALAGQDVAGAVVAQVRRALCVVSAGDCAEDRKPCVTDTDDVRESQHVVIASIRVGRGRVTLREHRSDGTVAVTTIKDHDLGFAVGQGAEAHAGSWSIGSGMRGALLARLGSGSTTVFADERAADKGMAMLAQGVRPPALARERIVHGGAVAELDDRGAMFSGHADSSLIVGRSIDEASGRTTYLLRGSLRVAGAIPHAGGALDASAAVTLTRAADGRFVDLGVLTTAALQGAGSVPAVASPVAGMLPGPSPAGGRRWVLEQHLDLTDPDNRQAASAFVASLTHPARLPHAGADLVRTLAERGVTDVRAYRLETEDDGAGLHVAGDGVQVGVGDDTHTERTHLLAALQRGPDGIWRRRTDCLAR